MRLVHVEAIEMNSYRMKGSGLSIDRFIVGKAPTTKADAKSKKNKLIRKGLRRREYEKVKKREHNNGNLISQLQNASRNTSNEAEKFDNKRPSFYDQFFNTLKQEIDTIKTPSTASKTQDNDTKSIESHTKTSNKNKKSSKQIHLKQTKNGNNADNNDSHHTKPDPFYKARKKAVLIQMEKQQIKEQVKKKKAMVEKKITDRKKRHVKLSIRTTTGQPVVRNQIKDLLSKLKK